ncbi:MAG: hypothetical protein RBT11_15000 [Desulfobacterales bacterium]|jgi:hypothetical protein|nr:hypothetical protein [Desulfobacterales bacterium]
MKQLNIMAVMLAAMFFSIVAIAMAADMPSHEGHGKDMIQPPPEQDAAGAMTHDQQEASGAGVVDSKMDHDPRMGEMIRNATVEGFQFTYHLIDMREKMKEMNAAGHGHEMNATHHLMVYIVSPEGTPVTDAKVGYLIEGPGETTQKTMCMRMNDGFGADISYGVTGEYTLTCKAVAGDVKLMDKFIYSVK